MARSQGRIMSAIWMDPDFISLESEPQRLYMFLLSQADLSHAGLLPLRVRKWASKVHGATVADIQKALAVLCERRFVIADEDTEELLVRTLVRNDGVYKQPKVMLRMREDARLIESERLREAFLVELNRLPLDELSDSPGGRDGDQPSTRQTVAAVVDDLRRDFAGGPGYPSAGVSDTHPPHEAASPADDAVDNQETAGQSGCAGVSDTHPEGYAEPPRVRAGALPLPPTPVPLPPTPVPPTAARGSAAARDESAQTLIAEWINHCGDKPPPGRVKGQVGKELKAMLDEGIPVEDVRAGLAAWHAKGAHPSSLASLVHEQRTAPQRNGNKPSTTDERVAAGLALVRKYEALEALEHTDHPPAIGH